MRKNVLSLSIAAMIGGLGFAGAASAGVSYVTNGAAGATAFLAQDGIAAKTNATALEVNAKGVGHNLLTPYFSVQNGNGTLLSIVNTDTKNGKAVKVRFRGASNSDDVFDFTVLMSPGDVWTANVYKDENGRARLFTPDNSCTLPRRSELNAQPFMLDRVFGADDAAKAKETLEGYVEIFNMADIPAKLAGAAAGKVLADADATSVAAFANPLYTAIKHVGGKNPCGSTADGAALPDAVLALKKNIGDGIGGALAANAGNDTATMQKGLWVPTTGLMGSWTILNQSTGFVSWSANMVAVEARVGGAAAAGRVVFSPQMGDTVDAGVVNALTADPLLRVTNATAGSSVVTAAQYDLPDMSTPYLVQPAAGAPGVTVTDTPLAQANALTKTLSVANVMNEYVTNPSINAQTDWVFSMPTRRYSVAVWYNAPSGSTTKPATVFNGVASATGVVGTNTGVSANGVDSTSGEFVISQYFTAANTKMGTGGSSGNPTYQACVSTGNETPVTAFDQEESSASSDFVVSPGTAKKVVFCGETSVLTMNSTSSLGAAIAAKDIQTGFQSGWLSVATPGNNSLGLPVMGHSFVKLTGTPAAGKSTNYSITQEHRYK